MTNKMTAKEAVKQIKKNCYFASISEKTKEALDMAIKALEQQPCEDMGEVSDGYHTFNQLYHQRAVLFATIVNQNKDKSWKSFKHSDGNYCFDSNGEWFIVGIDTPQGSYTYHYAKEYWGIFDCQELECGKEWDGHTEEDVIRLLSLEQQTCEDCINCISRESIKQKLQEHRDFYVNAYGGFSNLPQNDKSRVDEIDNCIAMVVNEPPVIPQFTDEEIDKAQAVEQAYVDKMVELAVKEIQRPKGKWIRRRPSGCYSEYIMECSECKGLQRSKYNFCPSCGCRMEVEE